MIKAENHIKLAYIATNEVYKKNSSMNFEEVLSAAMLGLVKAANRFDEKKGFKFSTYAMSTMRGQIKNDYYHDKNRFIRKRNGNTEIYEKVSISSLNDTLPLNLEKDVELIDTLPSNFEIAKLDLKNAISKLPDLQKQVIKIIFFKVKHKMRQLNY
ncbi:sigma-70 family RNA polymerase sigma factor [Clostridium perfringens]|uniref:sigma-70 family RNA polymerase sigma factor n=1 Tax=Clostridium perfringens TaxID=1502 RepID=UPI001FAC1044|nr:sigma-70 family RNA polymerase sigma factor [Clostridium perfringens]